MSKTWRVIDLIHWSESYFKEKGFQNSRPEIEWLLCSVLNCNRLDLYMRFDEPLSQKQLATLRSWVKRRMKNEPLQYITGSCDFYGRDFIVDKEVLIPRAETERLIDPAIKCVENISSPKILDIGTGSGCIAITMAKEMTNSLVLGVDKSLGSISLAQKNCSLLKADNVSFIEMDILNTLPDDKYDLVISNPPYISKKEMPTLMQDVKDYEPEIALTDFSDGLSFYKRFSKIFHKILKPDSFFVLEVGLGKHPSQVVSLFEKEGFSNIEIINDYNGDQRVLIIKN